MAKVITFVLFLQHSIETRSNWQMFPFISLSNLSHADSFWEGIHVVTSEENPTVWAFLFRDGGVIMF